MAENWHEAGSEWSADSLALSAGCSVSVSDTIHSTGNIAAVVGRTEVEEWEDRTAGGTFTSTDFTIKADRLKFNGVVKLPVVGWLITWVRPGRTETYQALRLPSKDCYTPAGQYGESLRIHTKLIGKE
ncbi:MAG: hypothetical protein V4719_00825 [Planctomycetota bacterium]